MPAPMDRETPPAPDYDRLSLRDHVVEADIGAFAEERGQTQPLVFNIMVEILGRASEDDVDSVVTYEHLPAAVAAELAARRTELLETLGEGICDRLLAHPRVARVELSIHKTDRVPGLLGIEMARSAASAGAQKAAAPPPQVFCLPADAWLEPWFPGWVAELPEGPVVLAVEGAAIPGGDAAVRRIRYLLSEAAAWAMQAAVAQADVVASRTEMAYVFETGRRAIWAPSKMLFAARGIDGADLDDFGRAVGWFAAEMQAASLNFVNRPIPEDLVFDGPAVTWSPAR